MQIKIHNLQYRFCNLHWPKIWDVYYLIISTPPTYAEKFTGIRRISPDPSLVWAVAPPRLSRGIPFLALRRPLSLLPSSPPAPLGPGASVRPLSGSLPSFMHSSFWQFAFFDDCSQGVCTPHLPTLVLPLTTLIVVHDHPPQSRSSRHWDRCWW